MKTAIKTMMIGVAACVFAAPAFAYTLNGTIPGGATKQYAVHLQKPPGPGFLKLVLSSPPVNAGVGYDVTFCIGLASAPATHPCPSPSTYYIIPGQQTIVFVATSIYPKYAIWLSQGTAVAVPYIVDVDYIP